MENMDRSLLERVNPVFLTAKMALCGLAMSGDKDASDISEKLKSVNREVKEILETTGFDSIIAVEDEHIES